ncbi:hypothetical protein JB92DRAFT_1014810 [Gautieria morchelliformis]|nr:hypothetical protein JB92DRAFT_1014810 [Gautieria morchelliformis]
MHDGNPFEADHGPASPSDSLDSRPSAMSTGGTSDVSVQLQASKRNTSNLPPLPFFQIRRVCYCCASLNVASFCPCSPLAGAPPSCTVLEPARRASRTPVELEWATFLLTHSSVKIWDPPVLHWTRARSWIHPQAPSKKLLVSRPWACATSYGGCYSAWTAAAWHMGRSGHG